TKNATYENCPSVHTLVLSCEVLTPITTGFPIFFATSSSVTKMSKLLSRLLFLATLAGTHLPQKKATSQKKGLPLDAQERKNNSHFLIFFTEIPCLRHHTALRTGWEGRGSVPDGADDIDDAPRSSDFKFLLSRRMTTRVHFKEIALLSREISDIESE
ncbi:hypothetical protein AAMO2058_000133000, partial [Amorphochlora amoebiformis]